MAIEFVLEPDERDHQSDEEGEESEDQAALIGWLFGAPIGGYYTLHGRAHVTGIILGALALISLAAALVGRRDGIGIPEYFDSTLSR